MKKFGISNISSHVPLPQRISQRDWYELTEYSPGCGKRLELGDKGGSIYGIKELAG